MQSRCMPDKLELLSLVLGRSMLFVRTESPTIKKYICQFTSVS